MYIQIMCCVLGCLKLRETNLPRIFSELCLFPTYTVLNKTIQLYVASNILYTVFVLTQGVFSLKKSFFEPRYILLLPTQLEKYINHLKSLEVYTPAQTDVEVSLVELYANTNSQRPRFFDYVIPCGIRKKELLFIKILFVIPYI